MLRPALDSGGNFSRFSGVSATGPLVVSRTFAFAAVSTPALEALAALGAMLELDGGFTALDVVVSELLGMLASGLALDAVLDVSLPI